MNSFLRDLPAWQSGKSLNPNGLFIYYDPVSDAEYKVTPDQLAAANSSPTQPGATGFVPIAATTTYPGFTKDQNEVNLYVLGRQPTSTQVVAAPKRPAAPTNGVVNDKGDTWQVTLNPDSPVRALYLIAGLNGTTGPVRLDDTNSYDDSGLTYIRVTGNVPARGLALYVAASGTTPDGYALTNNAAFTDATSTVPTTPTTPITGTRNPFAVPAYKRIQVADAIIELVSNGGQAQLLEPDGQWLGCIIVDNRTDDERSIITCHQQANFTTGATEFCWYRVLPQ